MADGLINREGWTFRPEYTCTQQSDFCESLRHHTGGGKGAIPFDKLESFFMEHLT
ncbi:hypothetical protein GCWU000341_02983 [Oribacterium sp. oral taxon 078 str. F0262]|nr:hypothetical protein GCWU000341_02983 [Oribacterium sp. oral taxon 078 str. F0262]